jgi:ABC-type antimicrobial peptide transport system permease subunit
MRVRDIVKTALGNLTRHKVRTALTTVGVVVGILTIVTMVSLGIGVQREMISSFSSIGLETLTLYPVTEEGSSLDPYAQSTRTKLLTPALLRQLQARGDVVSVQPHLRLPPGIRMGLVLNGKEVRAEPYGGADTTTPGGIFEAGPQVLAGTDRPPKGGLVVTEAILELYGFKREDLAGLIGRPVELVLHAPRGESQAFAFTLAGITEPRYGTVNLSVDDRLRLLEWWYNDPQYVDHFGYDDLVVRAKSINDAANIVDWLSGLGYQVESIKTVLDVVNRGMIVLQTMLSSVGVLALLVASIGIANTMIMAVYERTREIGILKAVGAAPGQIRILFVLEAALIGLLGGIVGIILGWLLGKLLNVLILAVLEWQKMNVQGTFFVVSWWLVLGALAFATLVGLLAGLYPAARAARLAPLDALRYE